MSMVSEFVVIGAIGSLVLGPKRTAKLMADASRWMKKFKAVQQEFTSQLEGELKMIGEPARDEKSAHPQQAETAVASAGGAPVDAARRIGMDGI